MAIIIIGSIPMAFMEPTQDSFFFRQVKSQDEEKFYPIYASAADIGSFIGKTSVAGFLLFLAPEFSFLVIGAFMLILSIIGLRIKD